MKVSHLLAAASAALAVASCGGDQGNTTAAGGDSQVAPVAPPEGGDWSKMVTETAAGGYLMGNPYAAVKVVEYGSMTCPHCAEFDETGFQPLVDNYVKTGRVSFEFRNFVRDPLDITMSLIARCAGPERFYALTEAMFESQRGFFEQLQSAPQERAQALAQLPPAQQFAGYAELAGLQPWAAQRGLPSARQQACLSNQVEIDQLVQMNGEAVSTHNVSGTPSFLINNELVEGASTWDRLEPAIKDAL